MLKTFKLIHSYSETKDVMAVAKLLHSNKLLEEVNMNGCNIDNEGACHLAQALCENTTLRKLCLSDNPIGTKGAMVLGRLIRHNKSLEEVRLNSCHIDSEGVNHLAQALVMRTLQ